MRKFVSLMLVASLLFTYSAPAAMAQDFAQPDPGEEKEKESDLQFAPVSREEMEGTWLDCHLMGKKDARDQSTGGSFAGGLAGGVLLGLIGTVIAVAAQGKDDPPAQFLMQIEDQPDDCKYTYIESYRNELQSKKRSSALVGGLVGTAIIVGVILATQE